LADRHISATIRDAERLFPNPFPGDALMPASQVLAFRENRSTMTIADGLAYVERTRRQIDKFDEALPSAHGKKMTAEDTAEIRAMCDQLEEEINDLLCIR
jgi:hypothetical protein